MRRLEFRSPEVRSQVKYAVSPTCTGKTACICPAFLKSATKPDELDPDMTRFSHYLYLAFSNNSGKHFFLDNPSDISDVTRDAEAQGAYFMAGCLKKLLSGEYGRVSIPDKEEIKDQTIESITEMYHEMINESIQPGRILVHVDEHRKMAPEKPDFRRGALSLIAFGNDKRAAVVATYVDVPTEVPAETSSTVCRFAVPVPVLDIDAAIQYSGCDPRPAGLNRKQQRIVATLKFRLAVYLSNRMTSYHCAYSLGEDTANSSPTKSVKNLMTVYGNSVNKYGAVLNFFKKQTEAETLMGNFIRLTPSTTPGGVGTQDARGMQLLLGISEAEELGLDCRLHCHLVSIADTQAGQARLAYGLRDLASREIPPTVDGAFAYSTARDLFFAGINTSEEKDLLSGSPLERAVLWALSTTLSLRGIVTVRSNETVLSATCKCLAVEPGRIFSDTHVDMTNVKKNIARLERNTVYYAHEGVEGETTHPICDIFFLTDRNELVVIDVTACMDNSKKMTGKRENITSLARAWRSDPPQGFADPPQGLQLVAVIMNPLELKAKTRISTNCREMRYIYGKQARDTLGGLVQFLAWY